MGPAQAPRAPRARKGLADGTGDHRIAAGIFFLIALNYAPEWLGILIVRGDEWGPFAVLDPNYRSFLSWLNVWIAAGMLHDLWLIGRGFKDPLARGLEAAVDGFGGLVLLRIVAGGPFTVLDVAFKPVIAIVAVIVLVSAVVDGVGAARTAATTAWRPPTPQALRDGSSLSA